MNESKVVQVCSKCKRASCWYGEFLCYDSFSADVEFLTVKQLKEMKLESEHYWSDEYFIKIYGEGNPFNMSDMTNKED